MTAKPVWLPLESAPRDGTRVWLTDGAKVYACTWVEDVHGCPGWRDELSFLHFRTWLPLGWQPYFKPQAPNWTREPLPSPPEGHGR